MKLKSKQEEIFEVEKEVACRSITVKNMVDDTGMDVPVPLPMVDSKILVCGAARTCPDHPAGLLSCRRLAMARVRTRALGRGRGWDPPGSRGHFACVAWARASSSHPPHPVLQIKVIEYCKYHHKAEQESLPDDEKNVWDKDFVKVDDETLFNLILAANYLDIKTLLDLTCKTVADEIKGKTPEEIRIRFNIKNDFTPEEEEEVKRENAWCEER